MIQNHLRPVFPRLEYESHQRVHARIPVRWSPRLHDALPGYELDVATNNQPAKKRECPTFLRFNPRVQPVNAANSFASSKTLSIRDADAGNSTS